MLRDIFSCTNYFLFVAGIILIWGCTSKPRVIQKGFYSWKSDQSYYPSENIAQIVDTLQIKRIYRRMFDVDWNEYRGAIPISITETYGDWPNSLEFVPVIFITNKSLERTEITDIEKLAFKIHKKVKARQNGEIKEFQLDCDWNSTTKVKYFLLIGYMRKLFSPAKISVTLRLHQFRYPEKTGVPPADKVVLMFYNMSNVNSLDTKNSILDVDEAKKYLKNAKKYPLKLDIALPVFSWGVVFRYGKFLVLLNEFDSDKAKTLDFLKRAGETLFSFTKDTVWRDIFFREGDEIRIEEPNYEELEKAANLTKDIADNDTLNVILYHLDEELVKKYGYE
ncbi:MAG: hypothetical protein EOP53_24240, partial [Sphingobacteriales bacterium]